MGFGQNLANVNKGMFMCLVEPDQQTIFGMNTDISLLDLSLLD